MRKAITYGEAWKILTNTDKKVYFKGQGCIKLHFDNCIRYYCDESSGVPEVPYHPDDKMFEIDVEDNDSFVSYGLHPDMVRVSLYGITLYQLKGSTEEYFVDYRGSLCRRNFEEHPSIISAVDYSGIPQLSNVEVHVDEDGIVTYVYLNGKKRRLI